MREPNKEKSKHETQLFQFPSRTLTTMTRPMARDFCWPFEESDKNQFSKKDQIKLILKYLKQNLRNVHKDNYENVLHKRLGNWMEFPKKL